MPLPDDPTLVVCPNCNKRAVVYYCRTQRLATMVCGHCAYSRSQSGGARCFQWYGETPTDSFFGVPLWMKTTYKGKPLWAFNLRHLCFLEHFVAATLRENPKDSRGYSNASLASRLPKWIKAKSNRKGVMKALQTLRALGGYGDSQRYSAATRDKS